MDSFCQSPPRVLERTRRTVRKNRESDPSTGRCRFAMACVEVCVPDGCIAGDAFTVHTAEGQDFDVIVPEGCGAGSLLTVDVPPPPCIQVEVSVPDGCMPGDVFIMSTEDGRELDVVVPEGCHAGDIILVDVPSEGGPPPPSGSRRNSAVAV